jgi:hypothetical protein
MRGVAGSVRYDVAALPVRPALSSLKTNSAYRVPVERHGTDPLSFMATLHINVALAVCTVLLRGPDTAAGSVLPGVRGRVVLHRSVQELERRVALAHATNWVRFGVCSAIASACRGSSRISYPPGPGSEPARRPLEQAQALPGPQVESQLRRTRVAHRAPSWRHHPSTRKRR